MRRKYLAMALGLGFGCVAGCGPTASDPGDTPATPAPVTAPGGAGKGGGGASGSGGPPDNVMKGMQSGAYRNMPGSQGPGGDAAKPAADGAGAGGNFGAGSAMPKGYKPPEGTKGPGGTNPEPPKKDGEAPKDDAKKDETKKDDAPKDKPIVLNAEELENIAKLTDPKDRELAIAQKICLVSEESPHLGAMGVPVKQTIKGKTIFLCCESCIEDLKANPDKYLEKLPK